MLFLGIKNDQLIIKYKWESKWQTVVEDNIEKDKRGFIFLNIKS